ncbi:hypothetical protein [uncultured Vibrio sp.]|uniref:hypothetical protein n=1 Tax=uncultured Vibrio sp. TaxID=114054 RepID=UPI0025FEB578|nr:hypothetical protein [uncultured Vibrio sp.]
MTLMNNNKTVKNVALATILSLSVSSVLAGDYQDMSDPMAVYTQAGVGVTNSGLNIKLGRAYDTNNDSTMAMHVFEAKGFAADTLGLDEDDSFDSIRYRHFNVNTGNGLGSQVDLNWDFDHQIGSASYSMIQALPEIGPVQLYPLAGVGVNVSEVNVSQEIYQGSIGYTIPSSFALLGLYSKIEVTDNIWLNYNPMYTSQLGGVDSMNDLYGWQHEVAASYQINSQSNLRAFWNFGEAIDGTDFRVEYNHQF